jgi:mRNA-degrading endonuclease RelE of RelBE toxin-antitoxin system
MNYSIILSKDVKKFLEKHEDIARIFFEKSRILEQNILPNNLDVKPLK